MRFVIVLGLTLFSLPASAQKNTITLPKPLLEEAFQKSECDIEIDEVAKEQELVGQLSGRLKLVEVYCWRAAYNFGSIFFAVDPANPAKAQPLQFSTPGEAGDLVKTFQLSNPAYDEKKKVLSSFHKGRGVGDCGTAGNWRWNGKEFVLIRFWHKDNCDGEPFFDELDPLSKYQVYPSKPKKK